jgi:hypothetical protein
MRNTVSQSELNGDGGIVLTVALKNSSATHTNCYLSVIAAIDRAVRRDRETQVFRILLSIEDQLQKVVFHCRCN